MNIWLRITINVIGIDVIGIYQDEGTIVNLATTQQPTFEKNNCEIECIECGQY